MWAYLNLLIPFHYLSTQAPSLIHTVLEVLSMSFHQITTLSCKIQIKCIILGSLYFSFAPYIYKYPHHMCCLGKVKFKSNFKIKIVFVVIWTKFTVLRSICYCLNTSKQDRKYWAKERHFYFI